MADVKASAVLNNIGHQDSGNQNDLRWSKGTCFWGEPWWSVGWIAGLSTGLSSLLGMFKAKIVTATSMDLIRNKVSPAVWVFPFTLSPSTWLERGRLTVGSSPYNPNHCEALVDVIWHYITKVYWIDHNSSPSEYKDHWWLRYFLLLFCVGFTKNCTNQIRKTSYTWWSSWHVMLWPMTRRKCWTRWSTTVVHTSMLAFCQMSK